jgi:hypothetical protein
VTLLAGTVMAMLAARIIGIAVALGASRQVLGGR